MHVGGVGPAATVAHMTEREPPKPWSQDARDYVLAAISVAREYKGGTEEYGPEFGEAEVLKEIVKQIDQLGGTSGVGTVPAGIADGLASVATGLVRLSEMLLDWIQNDADNRKALLDDVRRKFPDYAEPTTYPSDPKWSKWTGVLLTLEQSVKDSPTSD